MVPENIHTSPWKVFHLNPPSPYPRNFQFSFIPSLILAVEAPSPSECPMTVHGMGMDLFWNHIIIVWFQKISIPIPWKVTGNSEGERASTAKIYKYFLSHFHSTNLRLCGSMNQSIPPPLKGICLMPLHPTGNSS